VLRRRLEPGKVIELRLPRSSENESAFAKPAKGLVKVCILMQNSQKDDKVYESKVVSSAVLSIYIVC